jgi:hypothetical protein
MDDVLAPEPTAERDEDPVLDLLGDSIQTRFRDALTSAGFAQEARMLPETLASLAVVGAYPAKFRSGLLMLILAHDPVRSELTAYELVRSVDGQGVEWALTDKGDELAATLEGLVPDETEAERAAADQRLKERIAQAQAAVSDSDRV